MANLSEQAQNLAEGSRLNLTDGDRKGFWLERGFTWLVHSFAFSTVALLLWLSWVIFQEARPAIAHFGLKFLWDHNWNVGELSFGALPYIYGTLVSSVIALFIAVPIGLAVALIASENFLPVWVRSLLAFVVEIIAAIPSVIIGLWGIYVMIPLLQPVQLWLYKHLGWIPLFSTEPYGAGMLAAGAILTIMILPTVAAISREVLLAIPKELRSASMSLGATRWETIFKVLLPASASGILGAAMLALGRALGETMAVTMVIGNSDQLNFSLLESASTIPSLLANQFPEALEKLHIGALMYLALILFAITLIVNIVALVMVQIFSLQRN
ncbi:MAG: phosphate ABC transporter permease subunit PstC [Aphanothece sp. CMT-3BRIN-NPC111]|jgi:phosphate transport system permease protein|nr:phosphate ABC transporter permease subunit PstC [Aphanothece sp. CMT-3BRIN-NPC111]